MAVTDGNGAVTEMRDFGGYWLVLVGIVMAFCMAAASNLPAFLYGSSEVMAKAYGKASELPWRCAPLVQDFIRRGAAEASRR
jgi:hypothetical protein